MEQRKFWTLRYILINMTYFAVFCGIHAYASVYLLDKGFSNTNIGLLLSVANILAMIIQPIVAGLIDKGSRLTNRSAALISTLLLIAGSVLLLFVGNRFVAVFVIYALIYMIQMVYQPLIIAMSFEYNKAGCNINFGLCRGLGSFGFALISICLGQAVERFGTNVLAVSDIVILVIAAIMIATFVKPEVKLESKDKADEESADSPNNNIIDFVRAYPSFMIFLLGGACLFFGHNMLNDYAIQIIRNVGGSESSLGVATFLAAALELPTMSSFYAVSKRIKIETLLKFSGIMFCVKCIIAFFAKNMAMFYVSQCFQMLAYAVFIPASAYYVNKIMKEKDQVKGQAFINCAIVIGGIFSSAICGRILDLYGVGSMIALGTIVSLIGVVLFFVTVREKSKT